MERADALRDLKLLVESGDLDFTKGMDSLDKHVAAVSRFASMDSRNAGSPTSNPLLLKALSTNIGLQQSHSPTESTITVLYITNLGDHFASLHETGAFF